MKKLSVIAGTPVDTRMGVDYISRKGGFEPVYMPCFDNPRMCHVFQMSDEAEKYAFMEKHFKKGMAEGIDEFFIYCNSLSGAFDFGKLAETLGVKVVTPLDAYKKLAKSYSRLGVIAANSQATAGIEKAFTGENPSCYIMGLGMLQLVEAVESKMPQAEIVEKYSLDGLVDFFNANGAEALLLGCTHFPYFKDAIRGIKVIDPADVMYELL